MIDPRTSVLLTDLYQLTMLQAYFERGMNDPAVFELFVRKLPRERNFLLAAGLEQVLDYLENLRFTREELDWLSSTARFTPEFLRSLEDLRFTGDVHAMLEGTVFFPDEPVLRVTAPLREAQLVESRVMNLAHYQTVVASKAVRCVFVASGKLLVDFGLRRAHGGEAGLLSARASYLAGFSGTATVLAGALFDIPIYGTLAHSFIQAHQDEALAFENFVRSHPGNTTLLIDTYDTELAAQKIVALAAKWRNQGIAIGGVRLDSGDLGEHARRVRGIFDAGGLGDVQIFASGNLDEYKLRDLVASGAPIDGFGVGARMNTSADAPYLDSAYKLEEYAGLPRRKSSEGKATWPGRKQVYRCFDQRDHMTGDVLALEEESHAGVALLRPVMRNGRRLVASTPLRDVRDYTAQQIAALPAPLWALEETERYPVSVSDAVRELAQRVDEARPSQPTYVAG
jgi:nicotinate phosphoribosyltransferase